MIDRNIFFHSVVFFLTSILAAFGIAHAIENRSFDTEAMDVRYKIDRLLIDNGYCVDNNDCRKKKYLFLGPRADGVDVQVYGLVDQIIIKQIVSTCLAERWRSGFNFSIRVYSVTKDQELSQPIWNKPSYVEYKFGPSVK